jgi:hypothetical protein
MPRNIHEISVDLAALTESDFDLSNEHADGMERLYGLTDELGELNQPSEAAETILEFIERLGECDLGSPGPLVHTLETLPNYEDHLYVSVERKPMFLTVWMINRILNVTENAAKRERLLRLLHQSLIHPLASAETKRNAKHFIDYQERT